jgi:uncharacterized protein with PQ loop repeat
MSQQNHLLHFHLSKKRRLSYFDKMVLLASFLYPLSGIPQAIEVFSGQQEGVSLLSWLGFLLFSALFLVYGLAHRVRPMVVTNILWLFIDGVIVIGLLQTA